MSETKVRRKPRRSRKVPRAPALNSMMYKSSWTNTAISSGTTGTMSSWTDSSITKSSEYSVVTSLFTEIRLISAKFIFGPTQSTNGSVNHGTLVVSTNFIENASTGVTPTSYTDVQNQTRPIRISSLGVKEVYYRMPVPKNLEFANIAGDAPDPPTPWAGSPGVIKWYGTGFTVSTVYFTLHAEAIWELRGRQ